MRYVLMQLRNATMITQAEDNPDKIVDCMLDEYNNSNDPELKKAIVHALKDKRKLPTLYLKKGFQPIPYDPNLHSNLVRDGAIIGKKIL